jgi:hypothetical protein
MDGMRRAVARLFIIAKKDFAVASSQDQGSAQSSRSAADDNHIDFHAEHLSFPRLPRQGTPYVCSFVRYWGKKIMPHERTAAKWEELTLEERRERRRLRRERQRDDNVKRAAKMHAARLRMEA